MPSPPTRGTTERRPGRSAGFSENGPHHHDTPDFEDLKLGDEVALKVLPADLAADPARLARFHAEVRLARQVSHKHVCRVHDIGEAPAGESGAPRPFLSMEYVDGEDLAALLRRIGRLPRAATRTDRDWPTRTGPAPRT